MSEQEQEQELTIRRILVALDASTHSLAALQAAAAMAAQMHAELVGLYVEDENLLHFAGLPFAREVRAPSARRQKTDSQRMEEQLRLQAAQARRALAKAARAVETQWRFNVVRGQVTEAILEAALDADLLALGRFSRPFTGQGRLGSTARAATSIQRGALLFTQRGRDLTYPVLVTYDGSAQARQALAAAAQLSAVNNNQLNVLLLAETTKETEQLKEQALSWLRDHQFEKEVEFHWLRETSTEKLTEMVQAVDDCVLVLGGDNPLLKAESIQDLLDQTDCPVMLVR
ncbi:MAG: universal stress protein [Candidatus Promineifilaceae bacterium]|nr:universal stress protein [Candidatus Promineifilaceae bacterium]